jgi:hypothetical protein
MTIQTSENRIKQTQRQVASRDYLSTRRTHFHKYWKQLENKQKTMEHRGLMK